MEDRFPLNESIQTDFDESYVSDPYLDLAATSDVEHLLIGV
jgi:hypothetical protein